MLLGEAEAEAEAMSWCLILTWPTGRTRWAWRKRKHHTTDEAGAMVVEARDAAVGAVRPSYSWK
jgi:hypothetical protein